MNNNIQIETDLVIDDDGNLVMIVEVRDENILIAKSKSVLKMYDLYSALKREEYGYLKSTPDDDYCR